MATYRSFAKVNLHLQVVGRRADGYHELRTVFQTVDLHDRVAVELAAPGEAGTVELTVAGAPGLSAGADNLAVRAARDFQAAFGMSRGVRIAIEKRIPLGGGLGGGSSNAATVLLALREATGVPDRPLELWPLARGLGADVPYFLTAGTALGVGRGDEIVPLPELPESDLWLVLPPFGVSTASVFGALAAAPAGFGAPLAASVLRLAAGEVPPDLASFAGTNDLEAAALGVSPELRGLCDSFRALPGVQWTRMTGSGATLIAGIDAPAEPAVARRLPEGVRLRRVRTLSRRSAWAGFRCREGDVRDGDH